MTEPEIKFKIPNQVIDVMFFQGREANSWRARIHVDGKKFYIGPADIGSLMANVGNFIRSEAAYADARVHIPESLELEIGI